MRERERERERERKREENEGRKKRKKQTNLPVASIDREGGEKRTAPSPKP
jgi:hypothetical protein